MEKNLNNFVSVREIKLFLITAFTLCIIDGIFLSFVMGKYFGKQIFQVQKEPMKVNILGAALSYLFLVVGVYYFIVRRKECLFNAFLLGIFVYGVYEYTSYGLLKNWKFTTTLIDTFWGGILFMLTAAVVYKIEDYFKI